MRLSDIRVGFYGQYKVGCWTPVWVVLEGGASPAAVQIDLIANDADGVPARFVDPEVAVDLPAEGKTTVLRYAKFGRRHSGLTVEVRSNGARLVARTFAAGYLPQAQPSNSEFVLTVGNKLGIEEALQQRRGKHAEPHATPLIATAAELPDRWWGYEGVDTVCWAGSQPKIVADLSSEQLAALEMWVRLGGRLLLSVGAEGESLLAPTRRFAPFNPGRFVEVVEQRRTADLERYAGASQPILRAGQENAESLKLSVLADLPVREESAEGTGAARHPTVVRFPLGLGQVVLVTFDLDSPLLAEWPGRPKLVSRLLDGSEAGREEKGGEQKRGKLTHVGFDDLGGQLRAALDQFDAVPLFRFSWVAGLLVLYVLLIGPADYFFLRRVVKRMEVTWLTLPVAILVFCGLAWYLANAWKGNSRRLNQVDLVDIDIESGLARGTSWAHLYTPHTERADLTFAPRPAFACESPTALFTWQGLPGKGLGGLDVEGSGATALFNQPYDILGSSQSGDEQAARLESLPLQVSGTKSLACRWWTKAELTGSGSLSADADGRLQGDLINPLQVDLLDGVLFYETSAYKLKAKFAAGERHVFTSQSPVLHIERRLTQRRVIDSGETKTAWNSEGFDIPRILEMMMFHEAAGGRAYTGLSNRQSSFIDLSSHLRNGRAVLLAKVETPAGEIQQASSPVAADSSRQDTFYRLVFPVGKQGHGAKP